ncbi:hypothetical protein LPJ69_003575, partial [Coemansia sp. RSA 1752]
HRARTICTWAAVTRANASTRFIGRLSLKNRFWKYLLRLSSNMRWNAWRTSISSTLSFARELLRRRARAKTSTKF